MVEQAANGAAAGASAQPAADGGHLDFTPSRTQNEPSRNLRAVASSSIQQAERTASRVRIRSSVSCARPRQSPVPSCSLGKVCTVSHGARLHTCSLQRAGATRRVTSGQLILSAAESVGPRMSSASAAPAQVDVAPPAVCALDWEESAGISAPLYDIVDVVFELRSRGFFRRQVCRLPPLSSVLLEMTACLQHVSVSAWCFGLRRPSLFLLVATNTGLFIVPC